MKYDQIQEYCNMFLTRRRLIKKRCLYEFTLRCLHMFYRDTYNKILAELKYEEHQVLGLIQIESRHYISTKNKLHFKSKQSSAGKGNFTWSRNQDTTDVSLSKDMADFEPTFLKYIQLSFE